MKKMLLTAAGVLIIVLGIIGYYQYNKPHANMQKMRPDFELSATELREAFQNDEALANSRFLDKIILVTGVVKEIKSDDTQKQILLETGDLMSNVNCSLDHLAEHTSFDLLKQGSQIKIKGICTGILMDVEMDRCILMNF